MSSESISVLAYNVHDGLGDSSRFQSIVELVEDKQPTLAVFSEAYNSHNPGVAEDAVWELQELDYVVKAQNQEMTDDREDAHALVVIAKRNQVTEDLQAVSLASRFAIRGQLYIPGTDKLTTVFGHHGNDKTEALRVADTIELIDLLDIPESDIQVASPTIVAGDLNRMNGTTIKAAMLRGMGKVMSPIPALEPTVDFNSKNPIEVAKRISSLAQRLGEMASGISYEMLEGAGLEDVDPEARTTIKKIGLIKATLDYIMVSKHFVVLEQQVLRNLTVGGEANGVRISDHDAKYAELVPA